MNKKLFVLLTIVGILFISPISLFSQTNDCDPGYPTADGNTTQFGGFRFVFDGMVVNPDGSSTWTYTVTGIDPGGPTFKDLSHWVLALCDPEHIVTDAKGVKGTDWDFNTDSTTGVYGVKSDTEINKEGGVHTFWFTLDKVYNIELVEVAIKAGGNLFYCQINGPSCGEKVNYDYGDLPDEYGTLSGSNGARHIILPVGNPYLGLCCDADDDGCPCEGADGDDTDGNDDDGGVKFKALRDYPFDLAKPSIGITYYAKFEITVGTGGGYVNAWIDWNENMSFGTAPTFDQDEYIVQDQWFDAGVHEIIATTTLSISTGPFFHRWRITNDSGDANTPVGTAQSGEVEDYRDEDLPLPVELTSFTANATYQGVLCAWLTESEIENLGFILERKTTDGWKTVASYKTTSDLMGQGTTSAPTSYEYMDALVEANTTYTYRLADVDYDGVVTYHAERSVKVENVPNANIVDDFMVLPAYPNPFNPTTNIEYAIPANGLVTINIYDLTGSRVKTLVNKEQIAGWHQAQWNGENDQGVQMSAGMYLVSINTGQNIKTMKLLFVK